MASVNKIHLLGNCGRDPEIRHLPSGKAVANISIATTSKYKGKDGNMVEETEWHRVTFYDKLAEIVGQYVKKGSPIYVEGRIKYGKFKNKDGVEQNTCDIVANEMQLLGSRDASAAPAAPRPAAKPAAAGSGFDDMDDGIPF
jgi:single-strand DNA-binding protein